MSQLASALQGLRPPPQALVNELQAIRSRIQGTLHNPTRARIGAKYPLRPMLGRDMAAYYPAAMDLSPLRKLVQAEHQGAMIVRDQAEVFKQMTHQYRLTKGKTARPQPKRSNKKRKR